MPEHILKLDNILSIWMVVLASCLLSGETSRISAPEVKAVRPSEETLLKCRVTGSTLLDNNVTWSMNGTLLTAGNTTVNSLEGRVHVANHLNLWHLLGTHDVSLDQSEWMCKAGSTLLSWLIMTVPVCVPKIILTESSWSQMYTTEHADVMLRCVATGNPEPQITWYRRSQADYNIVTGVPKIILTESSWSQMYTTEHADVMLRCVATGNPEPQITWYRRSQADYNIVTDIPVSGELLVINNIERHASDIYVCKASSDQGSVTHSIELTVSTEDLPGYPVLFTTLVLKAGTWGHLDIGTYRCYVTQDSDEAWAEVTLIKNVT